MKEAFLMEKMGAKVGLVPVDLNVGANTGLRVSMRGAKRIAIVILTGASTAAAFAATLRQHNAASAGTSKDLSIANPYYHKLGAATIFTKVTPSSAAALYDLASLLATDGGIVVFEVQAEQLDVNNGYDWVSLDIADTTAAKVGTILLLRDGESLLPPYDQAI